MERAVHAGSTGVAGYAATRMPELPDIQPVPARPRPAHRRARRSNASAWPRRSSCGPSSRRSPAAEGRTVSGTRTAGQAGRDRARRRAVPGRAPDDCRPVPLEGRRRAVPGRVGLLALDFDARHAAADGGGSTGGRRCTAAGTGGARAHDPGGLEVLDSQLRNVRRRLVRRENHTLKRALTDPHILSGIGNAYSDEILHAARLSPFKQTQRARRRGDCGGCTRRRVAC